MPQVIVWSQQDNTLAVCFPTGEIPIEDVLKKDVPSGVAARIIDLADLPLPINNPAFGAVRMTPEGVFSVDQAEAKRLTAPPTTEQKIALAGLTIAELKTALGL